MDNKETNSALIRSDMLIHNDEYFKYIFKKTEKVVSAVFYTTRSLSEEDKKDILVAAVEDRALRANVLVEKTLTASGASRIRGLEEFRVALVALESALTFLTAGRIMRDDLLEVFRHELGNLQRSLREYTHESPKHAFGDVFDPSPKTGDRRRLAERAPLRTMTSDPAHRVPEGGLDRRERILGIIRDKGQVTIKDVSSIITDCSEKTIQRELMSLISERLITKEGERRWSKYALAGV